MFYAKEIILPPMGHRWTPMKFGGSIAFPERPNPRISNAAVSGSKEDPVVVDPEPFGSYAIPCDRHVYPVGASRIYRAGAVLKQFF
jgi:hypothetical protein